MLSVCSSTSDTDIDTNFWKLFELVVLLLFFGLMTLLNDVCRTSVAGPPDMTVFSSTKMRHLTVSAFKLDASKGSFVRRTLIVCITSSNVVGGNDEMARLVVMVTIFEKCCLIWVFLSSELAVINNALILLQAKTISLPALPSSFVGKNLNLEFPVVVGFSDLLLLLLLLLAVLLFLLAYFKVEEAIAMTACA